MPDEAPVRKLQQRVAELEALLARSQVKEKEKELCEQTGFFKVIVEQSPLPVQIHGTDGTLIMVNRAWEHLWGVSADTIIGVYNLFDDRQAQDLGLSDAARRALAGEAVMLPDMEFDPLLSGHEGARHYLRPCIYAIRDAKDQPTHIIVCIIVENANEAIMVFQDGLIKFFNQRALDIAGHEAEDCQDQPFVNFVPADYRELLMERHRRRMAGEDVPNFYQTKIFHKSGEERWLQMNVIRTDWEGKPASLAFLYDITEHKRTEGELADYRAHLEELVRKRTEALSAANEKLQREIGERIRQEKALRESELKLRTFFELSPQAVTLTDFGTGCFVDVNNRFSELTGFSREEVIGNTTTGISLYSQEQRNRIIRLLREKGEINGYDLEKVRIKDGSIRYGLLFAKVIPIGEEEFVFAEVIDMTERRNLEERLLQAQKMEAVGTLAAGIAHDFNNILNVIFGHIQVLRHYVFRNDSMAREVDGIAAASRRAGDLVRQILTFSRQTEQDKSLLNLRSFVNESMKHLESTLPKKIKVRLDLSCYDELIKADAVQMNQVISNLVSNAAYAMREKGGTLSIALHEVVIGPDSEPELMELPFGSYLRLSVADTGHGMNASTAERIFEPYFTTKEHSEGIGLGLAIVHGIVKSHRGLATMHSVPGEGTTFFVYLPKVEAMMAAKESGRKETAMAPPSRRIMLVDDEMAGMQIWKIALQQSGYKVSGYQRPREALKDFRSSPDQYDVVVTDQRMPDLSGIELAREIFKIRPDVPVILDSGWCDEVDEIQAKAAGVRYFIDKPHELTDLINLIEQALVETRH